MRTKQMQAITNTWMKVIMAAALVTGAAYANNVTSNAAGKPNIVIILADDFGYGSAGCYGA